MQGNLHTQLKKALKQTVQVLLMSAKQITESKQAAGNLKELIHLPLYIPVCS
jgi:hypothetical protein